MSFLPISRITVTIEIGVLMSAILVLEFEAGMADAEFSLQPLLDRALDLFNLRPPLGCHDDMAVERSLVLRNANPVAPEVGRDEEDYD